MDVYQKIAWRDFMKAFPTEEHCLEELIVKMKSYGFKFKCRNCNSENLLRNWGARKYVCLNCHKRGRILAGSFFGFIRKARLWLGGIWLFERGLFFNAWQFHKLAKCAYSTALMIFRKLCFVINENLQEFFPNLEELDQKLDLNIEVETTDEEQAGDEDEVSIEEETNIEEEAKIEEETSVEHIANVEDLVESQEFISIFWKRSNQTPIGKHPMSEQDIFDEEGINNQEIAEIEIKNQNEEQTEDKTEDIQSQSGFIFGDNQKKIYEFINFEKVHLDQICQNTQLPTGEILACLTFLEVDNFIERHGGDYYSRKVLERKSGSIAKKGKTVKEISSSAQSKIDQFLDYVKSEIHGISRKYLQLYLAYFWCKFDRIRWGADKLLEACVKSQFRPSSEIFEYVTPPNVLLA